MRLILYFFVCFLSIQIAKGNSSFPPTNQTQEANYPPPRGNRYADKSDVRQLGAFGVPVRIGDFIIDTKYGKTNGVQFRKSWGNSPKLSAGAKILIRGGQYDVIHLEIPEVEGSTGNPVIITNYFGQVEVRKVFQIVGGRHIKLTGRFEPNQSGDKQYLGHAEEYGYSSRKYGFFLNNKWTDKKSNLLRITGSSKQKIPPCTYLEVEFVEIGNGGFSGVNAKDDNTSFPDSIMYLHLHDLYIHDTHSEGMYLGYNTISREQHAVTAKIENNRIVRTGAEGIQLGNSLNSTVNNNVIHAAIAWKNPFKRYQDNSIQLATRGGVNIVEKNIVLHAGEKFLNYYTLPVEGGVSDIVRENYFTGTHNFGVFLGGKEATHPVRFERNLFLDKAEDYTEVYPNSLVSEWIRSLNKTQPKYFIENTISDEGSEFLNIRDGYKEEGTLVLTKEIPVLKFTDDFMTESNWTGLELWSDRIGKEKKFTAKNTLKGAENRFSKGDYVAFYDTAVAISYAKKENGPIEIPGRYSDQNWEYLAFRGNGVPPDDYRLQAESPFNTAGFGLLDNPSPINDSVTFFTGSGKLFFASADLIGDLDKAGDSISYRFSVIGKSQVAALPLLDDSDGNLPLLIGVLALVIVLISLLIFLKKRSNGKRT